MGDNATASSSSPSRRPLTVNIPAAPSQPSASSAFESEYSPSLYTPTPTAASPSTPRQSRAQAARARLAAAIEAQEAAATVQRSCSGCSSCTVRRTRSVASSPSEYSVCTLDDDDEHELELVRTPSPPAVALPYHTHPFAVPAHLVPETSTDTRLPASRPEAIATLQKSPRGVRLVDSGPLTGQSLQLDVAPCIPARSALRGPPTARSGGTPTATRPASYAPPPRAGFALRQRPTSSIELGSPAGSPVLFRPPHTFPEAELPAAPVCAAAVPERPKLAPLVIPDYEPEPAFEDEAVAPLRPRSVPVAQQAGSSGNRNRPRGPRDSIRISRRQARTPPRRTPQRTPTSRTPTQGVLDALGYRPRKSEDRGRPRSREGHACQLGRALEAVAEQKSKQQLAVEEADLLLAQKLQDEERRQAARRAAVQMAEDRRQAEELQAQLRAEEELIAVLRQPLRLPHISQLPPRDPNELREQQHRERLGLLPEPVRGPPISPLRQTGPPPMIVPSARGNEQGRLLHELQQRDQHVRPRTQSEHVAFARPPFNERPVVQHQQAPPPHLPRQGEFLQPRRSMEAQRPSLEQLPYHQPQPPQPLQHLQPQPIPQQAPPHLEPNRQPHQQHQRYHSMPPDHAQPQLLHPRPQQLQRPQQAGNLEQRHLQQQAARLPLVRPQPQAVLPQQALSPQVQQQRTQHTRTVSQPIQRWEPLPPAHSQQHRRTESHPQSQPPWQQQRYAYPQQYQLHPNLQPPDFRRHSHHPAFPRPEVRTPPSPHLMRAPAPPPVPYAEPRPVGRKVDIDHPSSGRGEYAAEEDPLASLPPRRGEERRSGVFGFKRREKRWSALLRA